MKIKIEKKEAVKIIKEETGMNLTEKDIVDSIRLPSPEEENNSISRWLLLKGNHPLCIPVDTLIQQSNPYHAGSLVIRDYVFYIDIKKKEEYLISKGITNAIQLWGMLKERSALAIPFAKNEEEEKLFGWPRMEGKGSWKGIPRNLSELIYKPLREGYGGGIVLKNGEWFSCRNNIFYGTFTLSPALYPVCYGHDEGEAYGYVYCPFPHLNRWVVFVDYIKFYDDEMVARREWIQNKKWNSWVVYIKDGIPFMAKLEEII